MRPQDTKSVFAAALSSLLAAAAVNCGAEDRLGSIADVWKTLGWKRLDVLGSGVSQAYCAGITKEASRNQVMISCSKKNSTGDGFFHYTAIKEDLDAAEERVASAESAYRLMYYRTNEDDGFDGRFAALPKSRGFFLVTSNLTLYRIQTFRERESLLTNEWEYDTPTNMFRESFDQRGEVMSATTMTWQPWIYVSDCPGKRDCEMRGVLKDIMDAFANRFNFTVRADEADEWGILPVEGDDGPGENVSWTGVFGSIVKDEYDLALSTWQFNADRAELIAFTDGIYYISQGVVLNRPKPWADPLVFLHPFTGVSWAAIASTTVAAALLFAALARLGAFSFAERIVAFTLWLFFVVVNAYYSGALTMFFSTSTPLPFASVAEGMELYPQWKMILIEGSLNALLARGKNFDKVVEKAKEDTEAEVRMPDHETALRRLLTNGYYLYTDQTSVRFLEKPGGLDPVYLRREASLPLSLALPKASPLVRMLDRGILEMKESGRLNAIFNKWTKDVPTVAPDSVSRPFQWGHLVIVVVLAAVLLGLVFMVLAAEVVAKKYYSRK